jgi:hypothetical protein
MLSRLHKVTHWEEVNCVLRSDVMTARTPKLLTHPCNEAFAQSTVVVAVMGMASGHQEVLSMMVNRWVKPFDAGRGPTRSKWKWLKWRGGTCTWR